MGALLPWVQYNRSQAACKYRQLSANVLLLTAIAGVQQAGAGELEIVSGPGSAGGLAWDHLEVSYAPAGAERDGQWRLLAEGLFIEAVGDIGRVEMQCDRGRLEARGPICQAGEVTWEHALLENTGQAAFTIGSGERETTAQFSADGLAGSIRWSPDVNGVTVRLDLDELDLAALPAGLVEAAGLGEAHGRLDGRVVYRNGSVEVDLGIHEAGFDSVDGMLAAAGLDAGLTADVELGNGETTFSLDLIQRGGEVLAGSVYLPPPAGELALTARGRLGGSGSMEVESFVLDDPDALTMRGGLSVSRDEEAWGLETLEIDALELALPGGWDRWVDGPLAGYGLGGLATGGSIRAALAWRDGQLEDMTGEIRNLSVDDAGDRFGVDQLDGSVSVNGDALDIDLQWNGLAFYGLPFGASSARIEGDEDRIRLGKALRMPLLDGGLVIERLAWQYGEPQARELRLDARIEPVELAALTRLLEFPEFGGVLSGRFPGVVYADQRLAFTGGIDIEAFSGQIRLSELVVERPFGSLPALAAQVEIERLNLDEVTGAFNFGHMEGQMSGWMRDLRLLEWRPVAMNARFYTHEDAPSRRISQRAVENLSNLGGAPAGALVSATVMRVFSEFPYRRAGLACRLGNNICHIDGVAPHESGGFYILEGRSLPRLDIIGHRRLVDWPRLVAQLVAMVEER